MNKANCLHSRGFSLIELIIAVAIVAILAAVAVPSYLNNLQKTRRTDAMSALTNAVALQERWYFQQGEYSGDMDEIGGDTSADEYYSLSVQVDDATCDVIDTNSSDRVGRCFLLTAQAQNAQLKDTACKTFQIDSVGKQTAADSSGAANNDCWQ